MSYDPQNIFAKILRGELPCIKVYEDEQTLAFMDIMPQTDGHALVIPKEAAETIHDLSPGALTATILTTQKIANAAKKGLDVPGILLAQTNGKSARQSVPHLHFHIIPCREGEQLRMHATFHEDQEKLKRLAAQISAAIE